VIGNIRYIKIKTGQTKRMDIESGINFDIVLGSESPIIYKISDITIDEIKDTVSLSIPAFLKISKNTKVDKEDATIAAILFPIKIIVKALS
jgi:hypothetical protein